MKKIEEKEKEIKIILIQFSHATTKLQSLEDYWRLKCCGVKRTHIVSRGHSKRCKVQHRSMADEGIKARDVRCSTKAGQEEWCFGGTTNKFDSLPLFPIQTFFWALVPTTTNY